MHIENEVEQILWDEQAAMQLYELAGNGKFEEFAKLFLKVTIRSRIQGLQAGEQILGEFAERLESHASTTMIVYCKDALGTLRAAFEKSEQELENINANAS